MINKKDILKPLLSLTAGKVRYDKRLIYPTRDWLLGLLLFVMIITAGVFQSAYAFVVYRNITAEEGSDEVLTVRYNQKLVQEMLAQYQARALALQRVKETQMPPATATEEPQTGTSTEEVIEESETQEIQLSI